MSQNLPAALPQRSTRGGRSIWVGSNVFRFKGALEALCEVQLLPPSPTPICVGGCAGSPWASGSTPVGTSVRSGWGMGPFDGFSPQRVFSGTLWSCPFSQAQGWLAGGDPGQEEALNTLFAGLLLTCSACLRRTAPKRMGMSGAHRSSTLNCAAHSRGRTLATALPGLRPGARCQVPSAQNTCLHSGPSSRPRAGLLGSQPVISCVLGQTSPAPLSMAGPQRECRPGAFARLWEGLASLLKQFRILKLKPP